MEALLEKLFDIKHISSILDGKLYLGSQYVSHDDLKLNGIKTVIDMRDDRRDALPCDTYYNFPIEDSPKIDISGIIVEVCEIIHKELSIGRPVYVHCAAGISRSTTIIIAYLMKYMNMSYDNAYAYVKDKRIVINPNSGFVKQLRQLESM